MKKILVFLTVLFAISVGMFSGFGDGYEGNENKEGKKSGGMFSNWFGDDETVEMVKNETYISECSECHFAFQPGLLPERSWRLMMTDKELQDHFGEVLEYDAEIKKELIDFMVMNAAEKSGSEISEKILNSINSGDTPLSIAGTGYIIRKHDEIPDRMITGNKDVNTLSNCSACHTEAEKGNYDEDAVKIPNYPNYDD